MKRSETRDEVQYYRHQTTAFETPRYNPRRASTDRQGNSLEVAGVGHAHAACSAGLRRPGRGSSAQRAGAYPDGPGLGAA
jgi:hypothetical protein